MLDIISLRHIGYMIIVLKSILISYFIVQLVFLNPEGASFSFDSTFLIFVIAGFIAQLIDGALGMAYGVSCNSLLLSFEFHRRLHLQAFIPRKYLQQAYRVFRIFFSET